MPASSKEKADNAPEPTAQSREGSETILPGDDEVGVIEAVGSMLSHLGYTVLTASDGCTAIDRFQKHHRIIDLVILDMIMPGLSGGQAFNHLNRSIPVLKSC